MKQKSDVLVRSFTRDEGGATAIEYSLIVSLIFLAITAAVNNFADNANTMYSNISSSLVD
ncbi:MAG: Flp family type IVb pilin [Parvularculaceae bacterium]